MFRLDGEWQQWDFHKFIDALRQWVVRNPVTETGKEKPPTRRDKNFNIRQQNATNRKCVFCDGTGLRINDCTEVKNSAKRRQIVRSRKLCFNCLKYGHRATDCPSRTCFKCNRKHHTLLCVNSQPQDNSSNRDQETKVKMMASFGEKRVCSPIVIVNANGIQCRALVDTGVGNTYASAALINSIGTSPVRREARQMEMLLHTTSNKIEVHKITISNQEGSFKLNVDIHKVEKDILLTVPNPECKALLQSYSHLRGLFIDDDDTKAELPAHTVLGACDFSKIKTNMPARIGKNW